MQISLLRHTPSAATRIVRLAPVVAIATLVLLAGCRQDEKNRPIHYEKGSQLQTAPLNQKAAESLRHHALKQNFGL